MSLCVCPSQFAVLAEDSDLDATVARLHNQSYLVEVAADDARVLVMLGCWLQRCFLLTTSSFAAAAAAAAADGLLFFSRQIKLQAAREEERATARAKAKGKAEGKVNLKAKGKSTATKTSKRPRVTEVNVVSGMDARASSCIMMIVLNSLCA